MNLVEIENLNLFYQSVKSETQALMDVNLSIQPFEFVSIVGPSGCGKTTILSLIAGLISPTTGVVKVKDETPNPKKDICGYMFQRDNLLPWRNIEKNIYFGLEIKHKKSNENKEYARELAINTGWVNF